jgi:hypothetical protein
LFCRVAQDLGKSIEEVMELSVLELQIWMAYYKLQSDEKKGAMNDGRIRPRHNRKR